VQIYARIVKGCGVMSLAGSLRQKIENAMTIRAKAAIDVNAIAQ